MAKGQRKDGINEHADIGRGIPLFETQHLIQEDENEDEDEVEVEVEMLGKENMQVGRMISPCRE